MSGTQVVLNKVFEQTNLKNVIWIIIRIDQDHATFLEGFIDYKTFIITICSFLWQYFGETSIWINKAVDNSKALIVLRCMIFPEKNVEIS